MSKVIVIVLMLCVCCFALAAAPPQSEGQQEEQSRQQPARSVRPAPRQNYSDRYSILTERNIFLRDRSKGSSRGNSNGGTSGPATQAARRAPEETLLLRGIVVEQGEVRAYFEDIEESRIVRVAEGDTIARGRVASIGLDALEYEPTSAGGRTTFVVVGNDLTGKVSTLDGADAAAAMSTTSPVMPTGVEGLNPNDPNLTLEQKLKLRRAMELKK